MSSDYFFCHDCCFDDCDPGCEWKTEWGYKTPKFCPLDGTLCMWYEANPKEAISDEYPALLSGDETGDGGFGPWGAWRAFADHHMAVVFLTYWCARVNGWTWTEMQLYRILRDAVPQLAEPVGWSP